MLSKDKINIGVSASEHIVTQDYFNHFSNEQYDFFPYSGGLKLKRNFISFPSRFLKSNKIDLIHIKNYTVKNAINWLVEHEHGYNFLPVNRKRIKLLCSPFCKKIVFYSKYAAYTSRQYLDKVDRSRREEILRKTTTIAPAVTSPQNPHAYGSRSVVHFLFVGNEFIRKGGIVAWEAFNRLALKYDMQLTIVSNFKQVPKFRRKTLPGYPDYDYYSNYLEKLRSGQNRNVKILSNMSRQTVRSKLMKQADIFLVPTFSDSFGIATLEAMSEGLPIIASNINAIPEMLRENQEGLLVDYNFENHPLIDNSLHMKYSWQQLNSNPDKFLAHSIEGFTDKMEILLKNPDLREKYGSAAQKRFIDKYSMASRIQKYQKVYQEALFA